MDRNNVIEREPVSPGTSDAAQPEGHEEAEERRSPGGHIVYQAIQREGEEELKRSSSALAWSGLAAGLSMGFSLLSEALLRHHLGLAEFSHIIAGSVETLFLVATGEQSLLAYLGHYLLPTLAGNIAGGVSLVAALAHAQFVASAAPGKV